MYFLCVVFGNNKYRTRHLNDALDDIEDLIYNHGCESFYFDDDTTNVGPKRMIELAEGIKARGLDKYPWSMMARADCMNDAALEALKSAGLYSIKYGVESISEALVNSCEKGSPFGDSPFLFIHSCREKSLCLDAIKDH